MKVKVYTYTPTPPPSPTQSSSTAILNYCFFRAMNLKKEYTGLKYVLLIDSLSNNYFLLHKVLRKKIKKSNEGKLANF